MVQSFEPAGESLLGIQIFRELPPAERDAVAMRCQGKRVPAGHQLLRDGDESSDVYFIVSGKVRAAIYAISGKEVAFRDIGPGEAVGDLSALDGAPRSATVVAMDDSTVLSLSSNQFWEVLTQHQSVAAAMLRELTSLVRQLSQRVVEYSTLGVKNRIHAELASLGRRRPARRGARHHSSGTHPRGDREPNQHPSRSSEPRALAPHQRRAARTPPGEPGGVQSRTSASNG